MTVGIWCFQQKAGAVRQFQQFVDHMQCMFQNAFYRNIRNIQYCVREAVKADTFLTMTTWDDHDDDDDGKCVFEKTNNNRGMVAGN